MREPEIGPEPLAADVLRRDRRVQQAKDLLLAAWSEIRSLLNGPRPACPGRATDYARAVEELGRLRGRELFFPYLASGIGRGPLVELADGSVKYDMISGIGVHVLGHSHPAMLSACVDAALEDTVVQGNLMQSRVVPAFLSRLLEAANRRGARLSHGFPTTSGAMANENALKIAFQKKHPASRLLAFAGSFAGRSLALSQVTDRPEYRQGLPETVRVDRIPFYDPARPDEGTRAAASALSRHLARHPGEHAAMFFELVQGEGGFYPGSRVFFRALMEILKKRGVIVIVDEIQTFGRTTELFAYSHFGLDEYVDIVTLGKLSHVCATLFRAELNPGPGLLSQTFTSSTAAFHAAIAILAELTEGGYYGPDGKVARLGALFAEGLRAIERRHPDLLTGPYGTGAMIACTPLGGDAGRVKAFLQKLYQAGVIAYSAGAPAGRVRFLPPFGCMDPDDVRAVLGILESTLVTVAGNNEAAAEEPHAEA
ncbi:MAG: aminotransferase class III-fold pyridoxal phosphate-dependent enzyme [bacterium]